MKILNSVLFGCVALALTSAALAQVPHTITYQGRLQAGGTNVSGVGLFKFAIVSAGTNTSRLATATASVNNGFLTGITVVDGGAGYGDPPTVSIKDSTGRGASATAHVSRGAVSSITVNDAGSGYSSQPIITVGPPPANFVYGTFWSNDGTSIGGSEPANPTAIAVQEGLFNVFLGDASLANMQPLTPAVFSQPTTFLRIWFSDGVSAFTQLTPDQRLASVPYAMTASQLAGPISTGNDGPTVFNAGGSEAMRITTDGNLGIGVSDPGAKLTLGLPAATFQGFEEIAFPPPGWTTGGASNWTRQTTGAYSGTAAASVVGGNSEASFLDLDFSLPAGGYVKFFWKVERIRFGSYFTLCVDDDACLFNSMYLFEGNGVWREAVVPVSAGPHTFRWKLFSYSPGGDKAWLDHVRFEPAVSLSAQGLAEFQDNVGIGTNSPRQLLHLNVTPGHGEGMRIDSAIAGHSPAIYLNHTGTNGRNFRIASFGDNVNPGSFRIRDDTASRDVFSIDANGKVEALGILGVRGGTKTLDGGIMSEDATSLINFGINDGFLNRFGPAYNTNYQGGFLRVEGRPGQPLFGFFGRPAQTNAEVRQLAYITSQGTVRFEVGAGEKFSVGGGGAVEVDAPGVNAGRFLIAENGNVGIGNTNPDARLKVVNARCDGNTWIDSSDKNLKENFQPVDPQSVLEKVVALPITRWNYKTDPATPHLGPMAQDFHTAFGLGRDSTSIAAVDKDGVALAAIQGLHELVKDKEARIQALEQTVAELKQLITNHSAAVKEEAAAVR